jgi:ATP-dependent DNA helicase RecG
VTVEQHQVPHNPRQPYRVWCSDETGRLCLTYFNGREDYLKKLLPPGEVRVVSGKVELYQGEAQMTHPDHVVPLAERQSILRVEPVYGLTGGLTQRPLQKAIAAAVERAPELPEWQDAAYLSRQKWASWRMSLARAHEPAEQADLSPSHPARARLAFDELLASQLAIALVRHHNRSLAGRSTKGDGRLQKRALAALPFSLTPSQTFATAEVAADMASGAHGAPAAGRCRQRQDAGRLPCHVDRRRSRAQAALMAPTELWRVSTTPLSPSADAAGVTLALLTGRDGQK